MDNYMYTQHTCTLVGYKIMKAQISFSFVPGTPLERKHINFK